jgi:hypothetical protein
MAVAGHRVLSDSAHVQNLPPAWGTLYELTKIPTPDLLDAIDRGEVRADMERGDVAKLAWESARQMIPPASQVDRVGDRHGDGWKVYRGNFVDRLDHFDCDIDLVVTDPPYSDDALGLYGALGEWASRALCPGGVLAAYAGTIRLGDVLAGLGESLDYVWTFALDMTAGTQSRIFRANVLQRWKPIIVMCRPKWRSPPWGPDMLISPGPQKDAHPWQQNADPVRQLIERYSTPGMVVADPFLGGGTTGYAALTLGRQFVGCDIDPRCVEGFRP